MNISYNWLKTYIGLNASPEEVGEWLTQAGLEVAKITPFVPFSPQLSIGHTLSCVKHPNADKLKKLTVDIGGEKPLSIICGASNIEANQKVIVAPIGTTITSLEGKSYKIKKSKIRGEYSEGMICSADEIGVGVDKEGILVLEKSCEVGTSASAYFKVPSDVIFEIEVTPNMGNACSHLGVARELAAVRGKVVESLVGKPLIPSDSLLMEVAVADKKLCPRYAGIVIKDIKVAPSPPWLRYRLIAIGVTPINNVVDVLNFVMHSLGQPLHAFDYDKIVGHKLFVGKVKDKKNMKSLDGTELTLSGKELMISDAEGPLCMAGIIGGERAKVSEGTKTIFLESACFSPITIAKSARLHGVHTDASFRFERSSDIEMVYVALQKAVELIEKITKGTIASTAIDHYPHKAIMKSVVMTYDYIKRLIGKEIGQTTIHAILKRLGMILKDIDEKGFTVLVPSYRVVVSRPADIVEEIMRIYGYKNIESRKVYEDLPYPLEKELNLADHRKGMVQILTAQGYHEMKTNVLIARSALCRKEKGVVEITNPLSQAHDTLRPTLLYSMVETVRYNLNRGNTRLKLFELGKIYGIKKGGSTYEEEDYLSIGLAGERYAPHWHEKEREVCLYDLYSLVIQLFTYCGIAAPKALPVKHPYFDQCLALVSGSKTYAHLGCLAGDIKEKMALKGTLFFTEIRLADLQNKFKKAAPPSYKALPQTPSVSRDLSLELPKEITYTAVLEVIKAEKLPYSIEVYMVDHYEGKGVKAGHKSYTIRLVIQGKKTFKEAEVNKMLKHLEEDLFTKLGVLVRA